MNCIELWGYSFVHGYLKSNLPPLTYHRLIEKLVDMSSPAASNTPTNNTLSESPSTTSTMPPSIESSTPNEILPSSNTTTTAATSSTLNIPEILINDLPAQVQIEQES